MESIQKKQFAQLINQFKFDEIFNQLGWDFISETFPKKAASQIFTFRHIANKAGFAILVCEPNEDGSIPDSQTRKAIHNEITKLHHEHLIIFTDKANTVQHWELLVRQGNKPVRTVSHKWIKGQAPELLYQKLSGVFFTLEEDETGDLTIVDVVDRLNTNFGVNAEKVTKKFYVEFKKEHTKFLDFINGIEDHIEDKSNHNKQWYASLMLNRLMFCYFIQKKGFLDQDKNYLKNKLSECKLHAGQDSFYNFYRSFLLELFHDGLGKPEHKRPENLPIDMGNIPYLNGGLFDVHELERQFCEIHIDDKAFERIFEFFDKWEWHLDTREHATGKTINPDVIGYIFEKYINDRADMGAYYTKEDITDYIGKNTIIPFLMDETERHYKSAFKHDAELWTYLKESGDEYIYDAVKKGVPENDDLFLDLPDEIQAGFQPKLENEIVKEDTTPHLWEIRKLWNKTAPEEISLPTETYRELIDRRKRYAEVKAKIENGEIHHINDFITYNLNIRQFLQDYLEHTDDPDFIRHFYKAIAGYRDRNNPNKSREPLTILDPTCGSGAFLFAAMNILEPLYETCIKRLEEFTDESEGKLADFETVLNEVHDDKHPNLKYFIFKSIILNNLYGVDIMKEAVEIAKLRLFLKLVATVDPDPRKYNYGLEPLPDVDFNIRAGNSLVGFANEKELLDTIQKKDALFAGSILDDFKEESEIVSKAFKRYQDSQLITDQGSDEYRQAKQELLQRLKKLRNKLNVYLATNYGIDVAVQKEKYAQWLESHQPFHWYAEFYNIIEEKNGFDCIIGNPPYLEKKQINYNILNLLTRDSNAIHSMCIERSNNILNIKGAMSMIVPLALVCTHRMKDVQKIIEQNSSTWYSNFAWRPGKLFDQVNRALTIFITSNNNEREMTFSTGYQKWNAEYRDLLFPKLKYTEYSKPRNSFWFPKASSISETLILDKVLSKKNSIANFIGQSSKKIFYRTTGGLYWKIFTDFAPEFYFNGQASSSSRETSISIIGNNNTKAVGLLSSNLFWWWYTLTSNLRDLNPSDINGFNFPKNLFDSKSLSIISSELISDLKNNSVMLQRNQKGKGLTKTQSFRISKSKPIIDQIDTLLAQHYGFTEEELDFIINYDIKYRMGDSMHAYIDGTLGQWKKHEEN